MAPPLAEQYEYCVDFSGAKMPSSKASCKGPQAVDVLHGFEPRPVVFGREKRQLEMPHRMLSTSKLGIGGKREIQVSAYIETMTGPSRFC